MRIQFLGAVRTTTGSMHLVSANGRRVLLDCGLFQGKRKEAFERNRNLPFDPTSLDAVVLSHAHIDHSGNLPTLVKRGYRGPIYATPATIDLCDIMLQDSAHLQVRDVEYVNKERNRLGKNPFEPLYVPGDVDRLMKQFLPIDYGRSAVVARDYAVTLHDAGHILGSAVTEINVQVEGGRHRLLYTGDLGRKNMPILRDPIVVEGAQTVITESTYGNRRHASPEDVGARLRDLIREIAERRARLLIPAFSVGRTQQIVYFLDELHDRGEIPEVPVVVDSPLSTRATEVYERHADCYDAEATARVRSGGTPFSFTRLRYITDVEESKALNQQRGPLVIISASGMCEGGRIVHHLIHSLDNPHNVVLFVGFQAENTLGRYLVEGRNPVRIFGQEYRVRARIEKIDALSAHADRDELIEYVGSIRGRIERVFVVHGEAEQADALAGALRDLGVSQVEVPKPGFSALFDLRDPSGR